MSARHSFLFGIPLGFAALSVACADELPPPVNGSSGAGAIGGAGNGGSGGSAGTAGSGTGSVGNDAGCECYPKNATGSCSGGACTVASCNKGFGNCDGDDTNGCEELLSVDGNCGACGRSCLGATCVAGVCQPITLVSGLTDPWGLLVDDTSVYFSDYTDGYIDRVSKTDGSGRIQLAKGYTTTWFMVMDGGYIYFTTRNGKTVERVLADGSAPAETFLSPGVKTSGLVVDGGTIYFTQSEASGFVWRAPKKKSAATVSLVAPQASPLGLAVDETNAYWGNDLSGEVRRIKKTIKGGTSPGQPVATGQGVVRGIVSDSHMVFWASEDSGVGRVSRYNTATTKLDVLAVTEPTRFLAVDAKYVYWAASDATMGHVYRLEKDYVPTAQPAPVVPIFSEAGATPHYVAVDQKAVYLTDSGKGRVVKVAK